MYLYCILWDWLITGLQNKNAIFGKDIHGYNAEGWSKYWKN